MALEYTNKNNVSLALAVFLMYDDYEYDERPNSNKMMFVGRNSLEVSMLLQGR